MRKPLVMAVGLLVMMPVVALAVLTLSGNFRMKKDLPLFGDLPAFALLERSGQVVSSGSLRGKVWVAGFIFTHCAGQCPLISAQMARVQKRLRFQENFRLVSITVDPGRDRPDVLAQYAIKWNADPYKWLFLTGKQREISSLVQNGFRLASGDTDGTAGTGDISHSSRLVLIDGRGRIRGYYDALEEGETDHLIQDSLSLIKSTI